MTADDLYHAVQWVWGSQAMPQTNLMKLPAVTARSTQRQDEHVVRWPKRAALVRFRVSHAPHGTGSVVYDQQ